MNNINKHINKIYIGIIILINISFIIFINTKLVNIQNIKTINKGLLIFSILIIITSLGYYYILRRNIINFSNRLSNVIDNIINKKENIEFNITEETVTSKIENKLKQLLETIESEKTLYKEDKDNIKILISDISHQIKTPITNISMYNETLMNRKLNEKQQELCLNNMKFQVEKLEWLIKSLIKMSRLENKIINLNKNSININEIIVNAVGGIYLKAEDKKVNIDINCDENLKINCDSKWTSEAIFNIIENAVKYTQSGGNINIQVQKLEMFTRIEITDNGIGIDEKEINNIFKRFYRSSQVSTKEGVGLGLYLAREIITNQGGYIKVTSRKGIGSSFFIYMLN